MITIFKNGLFLFFFILISFDATAQRGYQHGGELKIEFPFDMSIFSDTKKEIAFKTLGYFRTGDGFGVAEVYLAARKGSNIVKVMIKNDSCYGIDYRVILRFYDRNSNMISTFDREGTIASGYESNHELYFSYDNVERFDLKKHSDHYEDFNISSAQISISEFETLPNNPRVASCLGYTPDEFIRLWNTHAAELLDKKNQKDLEEKRRKEKELEEENRKLEEENRKKERERIEWISKGSDYHLQHYENKRTKGFHTQMPLDEIVKLASHKRTRVIIINGAFYDVNALADALDDEAIEKLNKGMGIYMNNKTKDFWGFVRSNNIQINATPAVIILDENGKILESQSATFERIKNNINYIVKNVYQDQ